MKLMYLMSYMYPKRNGVPQVAEVMARMDTEPPTEVKQAMSTLITSEVQNGNWDKYVDFGFFGLDTEANSLKGWKGVINPIKQSAVFTAHQGMFVENGKYIDWNWIPNDVVGFGLNDGSLGVEIFANESTGSAILFGAFQSADQTRQIRLQQTGTSLLGRINVGNSDITYASEGILQAGALYGVKRTAANVSGITKNGVVVQTSVAPSGGKATVSPYIGGQNSDGVQGSSIRATIGFWWVANSQLDEQAMSVNVQTFRAAMTALT